MRDASGAAILGRIVPSTGPFMPQGPWDLRWTMLSMADLAHVETLSSDIGRHEQPGLTVTRQELVEFFQGLRDASALDTIGAFTADGSLVAFGTVEVRPGATRVLRAHLGGGVHPAWCGRGIGSAILQWAEARGRLVLEQIPTDLPRRFAVEVDEHATRARSLLHRFGYEPVRWFTDMHRELGPDLPVPRDLVVSAGIYIGPFDATHDDAVRDLHNEVFAESWGSSPISPEAWALDITGSPVFRRRWSFVATVWRAGPSGAEIPFVVGYVLCSRYEQDWPATGRLEAWMDAVAVRPGWRSRGIAGALLSTAMRALYSDGIELAGLDIDTETPISPAPLFAQLGYVPARRTVQYNRQPPARR